MKNGDVHKIYVAIHNFSISSMASTLTQDQRLLATNKHFTIFSLLQDVPNKNGFLTQSDFDLVLDWYKQCPTSSAEKFEVVEKNMHSFCERAGLIDHSAKLSYEECKELWKDQTLQDPHKEQ